VIDELLRSRGSGLYALTAEDAWRLARSRLSIDNKADRDALSKTVAALDDDLPATTPLADHFRDIADLALIEYWARYVEALRWCGNAFPQLRLDLGELVRCEMVIAEGFTYLLADLRPFRVGHCEKCGRSCPPIHRLCKDCARSRPSRR